MNSAPLALGLATGFGVGYIPLAPGTFGTLLGLALWVVLPASVTAQAVVIVAVFAIGVWSATVAEQQLRTTDPGPVVIDEVLGMLVTLFLNPVGWVGALTGFVLFRFFDVIKPYPANRFERLRGGIGVMADDAVAGVYANLALQGAMMLVVTLGASVATTAP